MRVAVVLGNQTIECKGEAYEQIYKGILSNFILEDVVLKFWSEYETAVSGVMLQEVDYLECKMAKCDFYVLVDGKRFLGSDVGLQIYPSSMKLSFLIP